MLYHAASDVDDDQALTVNLFSANPTFEAGGLITYFQTHCKNYSGGALLGPVLAFKFPYKRIRAYVRYVLHVCIASSVATATITCSSIATG